MYPHYSIPWALIWRLVQDVLFKQPRDFHQEALAGVENIRPALQVCGNKNIPSAGPCLLTVNHYTRPGFSAWWFVLAISSVVPTQVHWVTTAAWKYDDPLRATLVTPLTRWVLGRVAQVFGFTTMPPMPPQSGEAAARAKAVRKVLDYARKTERPVIGLAPEGQDSRRAVLQMPPPGAGRFLLHLSALGLKIVPVGAYEANGFFWLHFGRAYCLTAPAGLTGKERDQEAIWRVMREIAVLIPPELRGDFDREAL